MPDIQSPLLRRVRTLSWVALGASLLGVALQCDMQAADPLAPKAFWFAAAASLLPALAVLKLWQGGQLRLPRAPLALGLGALLLTQTLAYGVSPLRAHAQGAWQAWFLVALLFVGAFDLLEDEGAWLALLRCLSLTAALAGAWSVVQGAGLDSSGIGLACRAAFGPRIAGPLGNPNFAGGFFVLLLPVLLWSALRDPLRWARALGWLAALLAALGLLLSASKAALLGLGAEAAVAGHLFFWSEAAPAFKRRAFSWLGGALVLMLIIAAVVLPAVSRERLLDGWKPGAESIRFRELTWGGALQAVKERPLLGWGPGNFAVVYPSHRLSQAMAGLVQRSYEVSHAENWVVQTLVEGGLLGLLALGLVLACVLWPLRVAAKAWGSSGPGSLALALSCALIGSLACNLASLDLYLPSTLLPFCVLMALAAQVAALPSLSLSLNAEPYARVLVSLGLALFAAVPPMQAQMQWTADRQLSAAKALSSAGRFDEAIPLYQEALALHPADLEARYFLASSYQDRAKGTDLSDAEREYATLGSLAPDYVLVHAKLARLYTAQGRWDDAAAQWERQLQLDPYLIQAVQELSSLYASRGRLADAQRVLSEAALRFPDDASLRQNLGTVNAALAKKGKKP